jgi:hypothetical protein
MYAPRRLFSALLILPLSVETKQIPDNLPTPNPFYPPSGSTSPRPRLKRT